MTFPRAIARACREAVKTLTTQKTETERKPKTDQNQTETRKKKKEKRPSAFGVLGILSIWSQFGSVSVQRERQRHGLRRKPASNIIRQGESAERRCPCLTAP